MLFVVFPQYGNIRELEMLSWDSWQDEFKTGQVTGFLRTPTPYRTFIFISLPPWRTVSQTQFGWSIWYLPDSTNRRFLILAPELCNFQAWILIRVRRAHFSTEKHCGTVTIHGQRSLRGGEWRGRELLQLGSYITTRGALQKESLLLPSLKILNSKNV